MFNQPNRRTDMKNFLQGTILASKAFLISVVALVVAGGAVYAVVQVVDHRHDVAGRLLDKMDDELHLSDAQRGRIETVLGDAVRQIRQLHDTRSARMDAAAELLKRPQLTADEVRRAMQAQHAGDRRADTEAVVADALVQVHGILTPEQRAALAGWMQERMDDDWMHHHRHRRHHRGHDYHHWMR